jgi:hypothetical protein
MTRHLFRWRGLAFGLAFLALAGNWAVWEQDLLTQQQFSFTVSGVLIVLGTVGVIATFWRSGAQSSPPHPMTDTHTDPTEENHEATDSQP